MCEIAGLSSILTNDLLVYFVISPSLEPNPLVVSKTNLNDLFPC